MKNIQFILTTLLLCMSFSAFSQTQHDMNMEAADNYAKADKELNRVYNEIIKKYSKDAVFIRNLRKSQKLWVQFRETELKMKFPEREIGFYGSIQPLCVSMYLTKLTEQRLTTLKEWIEGVDETEGCRGSVHFKQ